MVNTMVVKEMVKRNSLAGILAPEFDLKLQMGNERSGRMSTELSKKESMKLYGSENRLAQEMIRVNSQSSLI